MEAVSSEQAQSILFGLALGDALGAAVEFNHLQAIKARYGTRGIQEPPDRAFYTDDTQMTLALAEGLLDADADADVDRLMQAVGRRFVEWLHSPENNRARLYLYRGREAIRGRHVVARVWDCELEGLRVGDASRAAGVYLPA